MTSDLAAQAVPDVSDFDYDAWIPPRMVSGEYNEHIARILRDKLLRE